MLHAEWPKHTIEGLVAEKGGWVNAHMHIDRAYTVSPQNWPLTNASLQEKWDYVDAMKRGATVAEIKARMHQAVELQLAQGARALCSFLDCDSVVRDRALIAADAIRNEYKGDITIVYASQPLKGVINPDEYAWFRRSAEFVDIIGGLPERDERDFGKGEMHVDRLIELALEHDKPLHIHADQMNDPAQRDTEMILRKTREAGLVGRVALIHCLSLAAQPAEHRQMIYNMMREDEVSVITCPSAWIDSRRNETLAPTHNAATPVDELMRAGVNVALGTDNIQDIYKPFSTGDMSRELWMMIESNHLYGTEQFSMDAVAAVASTNGMRAIYAHAKSARRL
jgi:cytosine deaminase